MWARLAPAALLALAAACGSDRDERIDELRRRCEELVPGQSTFAEAVERFPTARLLDASACRVDWRPAAAGDACAYAPEQPVCITAFFWFTVDDRACSGPESGTCSFRCEVRTLGPQASAFPAGDALVCAREFVL